MGIKELRQKKHELKATMTSMLNGAADREFTGQEQRAYDVLKSRLETMNAQITEEEGRLDRETGAAGRAFDARTGGRRPGFSESGFSSHSDFLTSVMKHALGDRSDERLQAYRATQGTDEQSVLSDPHGGFLVPPSVSRDVLSISAEDDPLAQLVTAVPMEVGNLTINARVDKDHSTSVSGGLVVTRRPELIDGSTSRMQFEQVNLVARDLFGGAFASENLINDSPSSFIAILSAGFGEEFANKLMDERINGAANGEFAGILNAPCRIDLPKETGQAAATIVTENIDKMESRCWKYQKAVWLANHTTKPQLKGLVRAVGTGGTAVPYFTMAPNGQELLDGRPIFFTEHCKTVGTSGDLILGNWSEYLQGTVGQMQQAESIHVRFFANERAFKFWIRNAGAPWWKSPLTPKNGSTLSPFVTLATRA